MPGPCSAPNGNEMLTHRKPENQKGNIDTGKTALKKGSIKHARKRSKPTRVEFERMNES
jgi:hypothetical protein